MIRQHIEGNAVDTPVVEPAPIEAKDLIAVKEAEKLAGVSDQTIYRWIKDDPTLGRMAAGVWLVSKSRLLDSEACAARATRRLSRGK